MSEPQDAAVSEVSNEPISTEIGSGEVEKEVVEESNISAPAMDGETLDKVAEAVEEAVEQGASDEEIKELVETFKFKANGKEQEVTLDWNNKEDIVKRLQMAEAAPVAMQKFAELEKSYDNSIERLKTDPWAVLEELGINPDDLAEERIQNQIDQLQKSPEQLAQEAQTKELEELRAKLKGEEEARQDADFQQLQKQAEIDLEAEISEVLSSTTELPKTPYVMKRVADALMFAMDNGFNEVTAKDVIPTVEKEINNELRQFLESMPDKVLEQYIGNKITDRLRKRRLTNMPKNLSNVKDVGKSKESGAPKQAQSLRDFLKNGIK